MNPLHPRTGDLIAYPVTPHSSITSKIVGIAEMLRGIGKGDVMYSHVAGKAADAGMQYEQKWPRAGLYTIDHSRRYQVWRIGDPTPAQTAKAVAWWEAHRGDRYNILGLLTAGILGLPHEEVCSQFYADGWHAAGIHFKSEGERIVAPNVLIDHPGARLIAEYMPRLGRIS